MTQTQLSDLECLIRRSILLTEDRRAALLAALSDMSEEAAQRLSRILEKESDLTTGVSAITVSNVVDRNDSDGLSQIDTFLSGARKHMRKANEEGDRAEGLAKIDDLLDGSNT